MKTILKEVLPVHIQYLLRLLRLLLVISFCIFLYIVLKYTFVYLYPFIIAVIISILLHPIVNFFVVKWRVPRSIAILIVLTIVFFFLISFIVLVISELLQGTAYLAEKAPIYVKELIAHVQFHVENTLLPIYHNLTTFIHTLDASYQATIEGYVQSLLDTVTSMSTEFLQKSLLKIPVFLSSLPHSVGMFLIIILGTFLILHDWHRLKKITKHSLPDFINISHYIRHLKRAFSGYFVAQLVLIFITGIIIFIGLSIIEVEHVLTITIVVMVIDLFPYIGLGLLFIPWIAYLFLNQQYELTIYLSVLYIFIIVIRQMIEPKILSSKIGIHPLFALITLFVGYQLWGIAGILLSPIILICVGACYQAGLIAQVGNFIKG